MRAVRYRRLLEIFVQLFELNEQSRGALKVCTDTPLFVVAKLQQFVGATTRAQKLLATMADAAAVSVHPGCCIVRGYSSPCTAACDKHHSCSSSLGMFRLRCISDLNPLEAICVPRVHHQQLSRHLSATITDATTMASLGNNQYQQQQ